MQSILKLSWTSYVKEKTAVETGGHKNYTQEGRLEYFS